MDYLWEGFKEALRLIFTLDRDVYSITWLSFRVALISTALAAVAGIPAGYALAVTNFRGRRTISAIVNTLMALPTVLVGLLCYAVISRRGPLGALELLFTPSGIIIGDILLVLPLVVALTSTAVASVDPRARETAVSLGASPFQTALAVLTEARAAILAAVVASFGRVISEVGAAMMLGGNIRGYTRTLTTAIALETGKGEFALAVALGFILLLAALITNGLLIRLQHGAGR
jgi:tungstate transport system permease protein